MSRLSLAVRLFFRLSHNAALADQVQRLLAGERLPEPVVRKPASEETVVAPPSKSKARSTGRNEALSLLAALQREARFVDFVQEPLGSFSDAQIGAVARDVHRQCAAVLERIFAVRPLVAGSEGMNIEVPIGSEAARFRLVGNVAGEPPYRGKLCHHGWQATRCDMPAWTGGRSAELVVAPAEVELK